MVLLGKSKESHSYDFFGPNNYGRAEIFLSDVCNFVQVQILEMKK